MNTERERERGAQNEKGRKHEGQEGLNGKNLSLMQRSGHVQPKENMREGKHKWEKTEREKAKAEECISDMTF